MLERVMEYGTAEKHGRERFWKNKFSYSFLEYHKYRFSKTPIHFNRILVVVDRFSKMS